MEEFTEIVESTEVVASTEVSSIPDFLTLRPIEQFNTPAFTNVLIIVAIFFLILIFTRSSK